MRGRNVGLGSANGRISADWLFSDRTSRWDRRSRVGSRTSCTARLRYHPVQSGVMRPPHANNQLQILESQLVIISIQESIVDGGSIFTEGDGVAGLRGAELGGGEAACATCVSSVFRVGTTEEMDSSEITGSVMTSFSLSESTITDAWGRCISSLY